MPSESQDRGKPDAILVPRTYPAGHVEIDRHIELKDEFAPLLGSRQVVDRNEGYDWTLIVAFPTDDHAGQPQQRFFPRGSRLAGRERYEWFVARRNEAGEYETLVPSEFDEDEKQEIHFGYLVDAAREPVKSKSESALERRIRLAMQSRDQPAQETAEAPHGPSRAFQDSEQPAAPLAPNPVASRPPYRLR